MGDEEVSLYTVEYLEGEEPETLSWIQREGKVRITYSNGDVFEGNVDSNKLKQGRGSYTWMGPSPGKIYNYLSSRTS